MRFHFAAGTNCQQAFQLMTLVKVCKARRVIGDYNISDGDGDDQSKGEQCACHMQGEQH